MKTDGIWFKDDEGRTLILRGANLGGSTKVPYSPNGATYRKEGFYDHRNVSFVGRPFPLEEADEHYTRLRAWGLTFLRFLITWEAVEHAGPGQYDEATWITSITSSGGQLTMILRCSSTRIRMCGVAGQAGMARRAGRWKPSVWI